MRNWELMCNGYRTILKLKHVRSLDRVWVVIDEFGLDFEVEKHILYLLRNAEKDQVLVLMKSY